jgi:hypothetical protein
MGFFAWLLRRDEPVAEAPPQELDDAEVRESMRREEWVRVYSHVYAQGLTGKVMSAIHGDILPASVARHLQLLKEFAAQAADAAMELADERFPLTTLDEAPQVMQAPSVALGRERIARATGGRAADVQAAQSGAAPAKAPSEDAKAAVPTDAKDAQPAS